MAEFGTPLGLAVSNQANERINDLRYRAELDKRAQKEAEAKAAMFANDVDFQNSANSFDNPRVKEFAKNQIRKIGEFYRNNPDALYNPDKLMQLNLMRRELKDNTDLTRGLAVDKQYQEFLKDYQEVAKNPNFHDTEAYEAQNQKFKNYFATGNQNGDAKLGIDAPVYNKPRDFVANLGGEFQKMGNQTKNFDVIKPKDGNLGEYFTKIKPSELEALTNAAIQQHGRQIDVETNRLGLNTPEQKRAWVASQIESGFDKEYHIGDVNAYWNREMEKQKLAAKTKPISPTYTPFDYVTDPKVKAGTVPIDDIRKVYGDKPSIIVQGNHGGKADLTGFDFNYDGRFVKKNGIPMLLGNVDLPIDVALEKGIVRKKKETDNGQYINPITGQNDYPAYEAANSSGDYKLSSDFLGKATINTTKRDDKGKPIQTVKVSYQLPVNPKDQVAQQKFNALVDVDKLVPAAQDPFGTEIKTSSSSNPKQVVQNGITYTYNEKTGKYE